MSTLALASLNPQAWRSMWACALIPRLVAAAARSTMRAKPTRDNGAPRSDTKMKGDCGLSRWWRRNSRPVRVCEVQR